MNIHIVVISVKKWSYLFIQILFCKILHQNTLFKLNNSENVFKSKHLYLQMSFVNLCQNKLNFKYIGM